MIKQDLLDLCHPMIETLWARIEANQQKEIESAVQERTRNHAAELASMKDKVDKTRADNDKLRAEKEALQARGNEERQAAVDRIAEMKKQVAAADEEKAKLQKALDEQAAKSAEVAIPQGE